jgi:hypothetical protein
MGVVPYALRSSDDLLSRILLSSLFGLREQDGD